MPPQLEPEELTFTADDVVCSTQECAGDLASAVEKLQSSPDVTDELVLTVAKHLYWLWLRVGKMTDPGLLGNPDFEAALAHVVEHG